MYPYGEYTSYDYELVSCNFPGLCPDGVIRNTCKWQRFLSFHCTQEGANTRFELATNGMPNHCYIADANQPEGSD
jgi:hypothetical protein